MNSPSDQPSAFQSALENSVPIFEKQFEDRTPHENDLIVSLLEKIPYIKHKVQSLQYPQECIKSISKLVRYEVLPKGQAMCHYGETPSNFWIILKGNLRKYIPKSSDELFSKKDTTSKNQQDKQEKTKEELTGWDMSSDDSLQEIEKYSLSPSHLKQNHISPRFTAGNWLIKKPSEKDNQSQTMTIKSLDEIEVFKDFSTHNKYVLQNNTLNFKMEKILTTGDSSANLSTNINKQYSSTLVAWTDVHYISISLKTLHDEFAEHDRTQFDKIPFLQQVFPELSNTLLVKLGPLFQEKIIRRGQLLFDEDSDCSEFYLIKKGEVELSKTQMPDDISIQEIKPKPRASKILDKQVMVLTVSQFLGEELILNYDKRIFRAEGKSSKTVLYTISKANLNEMGDSNPRIMWNLFQNAEKSLKQKMMKLFVNQKDVEALQGVNKDQSNQKGKKKDELKKILTNISSEPASPIKVDQSLSKSQYGSPNSSYISHQKLQGFTKFKKFQNIALLNSKSEKSPVPFDEKAKKTGLEDVSMISKSHHKKAQSNCIEISKETLLEQNNKFNLVSTTRDSRGTSIIWKIPSKVVGSSRLEGSPKGIEIVRNRHKKSMNETSLKPIVENAWNQFNTSQSPNKNSVILGIPNENFRNMNSNRVEKVMARELNDIMSSKFKENEKSKNYRSNNINSPKISIDRDLQFGNLSEVIQLDKGALQSKIRTINLERSLEERDEENKSVITKKFFKKRKIIYQGNFRNRKYVEKPKPTPTEDDKLLESLLQYGNEKKQGDKGDDTNESFESDVEKAQITDIDKVKKSISMLLPHLPEKLKILRSNNYFFRLNSPA